MVIKSKATLPEGLVWILMKFKRIRRHCRGTRLSSHSRSTTIPGGERINLEISCTQTVISCYTSHHAMNGTASSVGRVEFVERMREMKVNSRLSLDATSVRESHRSKVQFLDLSPCLP